MIGWRFAPVSCSPSSPALLFLATTIFGADSGPLERVASRMTAVVPLWSTN
jgi:hypothetical protein